MPAASYLLTFSDRDGKRLAPLKAVLAWLAALEDIEIVLVEQDDRPRVDPENLPPGIVYRFAFNDGPFNKSWGLNVAARIARHDLLVTGDADMILPGAALGRALAVCESRFDAVNPYSHLVDLDERQTRSYLDGELALEEAGRDGSRDRKADGEFLCFCGGICVYRREVYFALGGMDERFAGWGGEDDAMSVNLQRCTDRIAVQRDTHAYHLWHPRAPERYTHAQYRRNLALAQAYVSCAPEALDAWRRTHRETMGDPNRFRSSSK